MIIMEFKKTKTPAVHCTSDHPYKKMCQRQMMNSYADKNNIHFVIDKVPETLNDGIFQCVTDHDDFEKKTRRDPPRTIILRGIQLDRILTHPDEVVYGDEGSNVSFEWNFHIGSWPNPRPKVVRFVFGEWDLPGYVRKKILNVQGHNQVDKRPGFEKKLDWMGNVYECVECTAEVVMYNLTRADFKSYGVDIELGVDRSPLTNSLRLAKTEPVSITKWTQNIEVHEGNSTTIECRASGLPPPSVKIERNNQTLRTCNDIKPCVYKIQAAKFEDQGEYVCLVQQGNSSFSRSSNLTVLKTRKTWAAKLIADEQLSPNTSSPPSPSTAHSHSVNTLWGWSAYIAIPAVVLLIMKEGPIPRSYFFVIILAGIADTTTTATTTYPPPTENTTSNATTVPNCYPVTEIQTSGSSLTGYINEELDIPCIFQRQKGNVDVERYLCNPNELGKFVLSTWNKIIQNYTKACIKDHERFELCDSWTTSYVHGDQTHFVIRNTPWELNWCKTQCVYESSSEFRADSHKVQVIRLKARGNVNGTIKLKLFIPKEHILITFKINMIPVFRVEISNGSLNGLHCVKDHRNVCQIVGKSSNHHCVPGYDVCQEHMTSSYVNSSFVVFIFKNTPAYLNNSKLYYLIDFVDHEKLWNDTIHPNETVFLLNKDTTTTATTTSPPPTENTTSNATSVINTTSYPVTESSEKNGLSTGVKIVIIIVCILVPIIIGVIVYKYRQWRQNKREQQKRDDQEMEAMREGN